MANLDLAKLDNLHTLLLEEIPSHFFLKFVVSLRVACNLSRQVLALFLS